MGAKIAIIGAGGFAREVLDIFEACHDAGRDDEVLGYVVEAAYGTPGELVNGRPILGDFGWFEPHRAEVAAVCAVGDPALRYRLVRCAQELGVRFCNAIHPTAVVTPRVTLGAGVVIAAGAIFTNQILVGDHVQVNLACTVGHDAVLNDFATLAPGVRVSGNVTLAQGCYVGTGANIIDGIRVGEWSVVGAGSTVHRDVPPNTTVAGVPARVVRRRESGWHLSTVYH